MEDSTCHNCRCVTWPSGMDAISNYVIKLDETGVIGAIANSCVQFPKTPSSVVLLHSGIPHLALRLSVAFGLCNELYTMSIQIPKCILQLVLSGATQGS